VYKLLTRAFDGIERVTGAVGSGWSSVWNRAWNGPLQDLLFFLILAVTALRVLVEVAYEELDRLVSGLEKAFIVVALLAMTGLTFLDYLRREVSGFELEIRGGANMSVLLMVWVGFLGASLATRQRKHLSVDATDRILSPGAARFAKRFSALVAAIFCWKFGGFALELVEENLVKGSGQEGLPVWDWMVGPLNAFVQIISQQVEPAGWVVWGLGFAMVAGTFVLRRWRRDDVGTPLLMVLQVVVGGACALLLVLGIANQWNPVGPDDADIEWAHYTRSNEGIQGEELEQLSQELDDLVFGDTGIEDEPVVEGKGAAAPEEDRADLLAVSVTSQKFPVWLAQAVLPLSFLFMALRFFMMALTGSVGMQTEAGQVGPPAHPGGLRTGKDMVVAGLAPGILLGLALALGMSKGWLLLLACILLIIVGAPLFLAIGVAALASVMLIQDISGYNVAKDMFEAVKKEELLAIPFFVLAGNIMTQGSIATRLVNVARAFMGRTPGGLGLATVFACVVFAAISGSSPVTVIAVGSIMFPMLVRERYPENYSIGVLTSAGSLGIIIPPSVPMIIYAIMVSNRETPISANDLFIGGVLPGLFIAAMLVAYTLYATRPTQEGVQIAIPELEGGYGSNLLTQLKRSFLSLLLPVLILGGIYGILGPIRFTVTEAAAVAVVYALAVELLFHRELRLKELPKVLTDSGVMMGSLFLIIVLAMAFNKFLAERYIPQQAAEWLGNHVHSQWQFILLVNLFLLAIGCVMDIISAILIVAPLLAPIAASFGLDPIHFGIMFIVNLELGYLTPPMGINLFVASTVFERTIVQVIKASLPFLLLMLFCLAVIAWVPWLSTVLVR